MEWADRFWSHVDRSAGPDGCWPWTRARQGGKWPYGVFHPVKGQTQRAHRLALQLHLGRPLRPGMFALHSCDNPPCCNPAHLREGTNLENVRDAMDRGRHKRGENDAQAKLTGDLVVRMRRLAADGAKVRGLAQEFGVSEGQVSMILRGQRWGHVGGPLVRKYKNSEMERV